MRHPISFIGLVLGTIFILGSTASYFYYEEIVISKWLNITIHNYAYRQYSFFLLLLGVVFLVIGLAYSKENR